MCKRVADTFLTQNLTKNKEIISRFIYQINYSIYVCQVISKQFDIMTNSKIIKEYSHKIKKSQIMNISLPKHIEILLPFNLSMYVCILIMEVWEINI